MKIQITILILKTTSLVSGQIMSGMCLVLVWKVHFEKNLLLCGFLTIVTKWCYKIELDANEIKIIIN